jgi:hypothetical protein
MKKLFTLAAFSLFLFSAQAQVADEFNEGYKPVKGTITTEVGLQGGLNNANYNLNTGNNVSNDSTYVAKAPILRFRYFLKDDLGLRLGFSARNGKKESSEVAGAGLVSRTLKNSGFDINLGVEKHFKGSNRLSTYAGGDFLLGSIGASDETNFANGNSTIIEGKNGDINAGNYIGLRLFTGADYYIAKKLYLGVELGLVITSSKTKEQITKAKVGNVVTETKTNEGKTSSISPEIVGGIRLGYQF